MTRHFLQVISLSLLACLTVPSDVYGKAATHPRGLMDPAQSQVDLRGYLLSQTPSFITPSDSKQWPKQASELRQRVLDEVVYRGVPTEWREGPVHVVWGDTLPGNGYVIRKLRYEAVPGLWIGGLLYEPTNLTGLRPAVLNPNGHVGPAGASDDFAFAEDLPAEFYHLRLDDQWTLPEVRYTPPGDVAGTTLILSDQGCSKERDAVKQVLAQNRRAIVLDLLFAGECKPIEGRVGQWGMMISALGRRPLGVQVAQLGAVIAQIRRDHPAESLQLLACGRVSGLAALTWSALNPGGVEAVQLKGMERSLKDMLAKKVSFNDEPSVFCFGLLQVADVADLIDLALPTKVEILAAEE